MTADRAPGAPAPPVVGRVNQHPRIVAAHRIGSLSVALPAVAGVVLAPVYSWHLGVTTLDLVLLASMYWLTLGVGLSVGFHRHFTHGAFRAPRAFRWLMAVLGSMGAQGPLTYWVAVHRRHHECADAVGDPHSPRPTVESRTGRLRALWHAHFGWSLSYGMPNAALYCPDIARDPILSGVSRQYRFWVVAGWLAPALVGGWVGGGFAPALGGFLWGGLVRTFLSSNMTWSLNSICHRYGSRPHDVGDTSANNAWLALPTLGESWHNNHHAHPSSARHGLRWWELDLNYAFIVLLEAIGLATQVKRPTTLRTGSR